LYPEDLAVEYAAKDVDEAQEVYVIMQGKYQEAKFLDYQDVLNSQYPLKDQVVVSSKK